MNPNQVNLQRYNNLAQLIAVETQIIDVDIRSAESTISRCQKRVAWGFAKFAVVACLAELGCKMVMGSAYPDRMGVASCCLVIAGVAYSFFSGLVGEKFRADSKRSSAEMNKSLLENPEAAIHIIDALRWDMPPGSDDRDAVHYLVTGEKVHLKAKLL